MVLSAVAPTKDFKHSATLQSLGRHLRDKELNIYDADLDQYLKATALSHLPQSTILKNALETLKPCISEAYLRGSFSTGLADDYSDIDLFVVVEPDQLEEAFLKFINHSRKSFDIVSICHDKLVADYGGIGFMALLKDTTSNKVSQFDLYFAIAGSQPKIPLVNCPRVYSKDLSYSIFCEKTAAERSFDHSNLLSQIADTNNPDIEDIRHDLHDLVVTAFIMSKHIKRGQAARAKNDDVHANRVCTQLLKNTFKIDSHHSHLYLGDHLATTAINSGDEKQAKAGRILNNMFRTVPSQEQLDNIANFVEVLTDSYYPSLKDEFVTILSKLQLSTNLSNNVTVLHPLLEKKLG